MNRRGFTLIEVIMVIAIIALLSLLLVPNVISLINKNNIESCENLKKNIVSAAKIYVNNNKYDLDFVCDTSKEIELQTLVNSGDLKTDNSGKLINPIDKSEIPLGTVVTVTYNCNTKTFTYVISEDDIDCTK